MAQLADKWRAKYPGDYDDMDDATLEAAILKKHPEYEDLATPKETAKPIAAKPAARPAIDISDEALSTGPAPQQISEPTTQWGGFLKSIVDQIREPTVDSLASLIKPDTRGGFLESLKKDFVPTWKDFSLDNPMLRGAAHPETAADFANLVIPEVSGVPDAVRNLFGGQGKLPEVAESIKSGNTTPFLDRNPQLNMAYQEGERMMRNLKNEITTKPRPSGPWDTNPDLTPKSGVATEDLQYNLARDKFNMGRDMPPNEVTPENYISPPGSKHAIQVGDSIVDPETGELLVNSIKESKAFDPSTIDFAPSAPVKPQFKSPARTPKPVQEIQDIEDVAKEFKLPSFLKGAKPRFNFGSNTFTPKFESDLDKALYIIAQPNPSERNADYLRLVMEHTGMDEQNAVAAGREIRSKIKGLLKGQESGEVNIPSLFESKTTKPTAEFLGLQENGEPLFNISGGPSGRSTVGAAKLQELGIQQPIIPEGAVPMKGEQLRELAIKGKRTLADETGAVGELPPGNQNVGPQVTEKTQQMLANRTPKTLDEINQIGKFANESQKKSLYHELRDANRAILTAYDFSAPGRQGAPLMLNKSYWTSFDDMFKSWGSQRAYDAVQDSIYSHPNFTSRVIEGKKLPSLAERAGLKIRGNEEMFQSKLAEKLPGVTRSERAYNAFLGKLRADTFNSMISDAEAMGLRPKYNDVLLKKYASFINDATGRGSLGKLERAAPILNEAFFAPRLMASRVNMYKRVLNPMTYITEDPVIRKQTLKSLLALVGFGNLVGQTAKLGGAQVNSDPNSSDFGKIKIGSSRIDPFAGFQQYAVGASRLISGKSISTSAKNYGRSYDLTTNKFGMPTRKDIVSNFMTNKLAPVPSLVWAWLSNKEFDGTPFEAKQAIMSRTVPIVMQDLYDIGQSDPNLFPPGFFRENPTATKVGMSAMPMFGEGIQTYGR